MSRGQDQLLPFGQRWSGERRGIFAQCLVMLGNQISKRSSGNVNAGVVEEFWRPLEKARTSESGRYNSARLRDQEKAFCMVRRRGDSWPRADTSSIESMAALRTRSA